MKKAFSGIFAITRLLGASMAFGQTDTQACNDGQPSATQVKTTKATDLTAGGISVAIAIYPRVLDFGSTAIGSTNTLTITVRSVAGGVFTGAVNVAPPFQIVGGCPYAIKNSHSQVITVGYAPKSIGMHMTVIRVTGSSEASITVMGSGAPRLRSVPERRPKRTRSEYMRMIAAR